MYSQKKSMKKLILIWHLFKVMLVVVDFAHLLFLVFKAIVVVKVIVVDQV